MSRERHSSRGQTSRTSATEGEHTADISRWRSALPGDFVDSGRKTVLVLPLLAFPTLDELSDTLYRHLY